MLLSASALLPILLLALAAFVAASPGSLSSEGAELVFMDTLAAIEDWEGGSPELSEEGGQIAQCGESRSKAA